MVTVSQLGLPLVPLHPEKILSCVFIVLFIMFYSCCKLPRVPQRRKATSKCFKEVFLQFRWFVF